MDGEHCLTGFTNRDIRAKLQLTPLLRPFAKNFRKQSARANRIFRQISRPCTHREDTTHPSMEANPRR